MNEDQKAFIDQLKYGQSFMLNGKRIDPKDIYMDKPHAIRLADALDQLYKTPPSVTEAASELRKLHEANQELVEALDWCVAEIGRDSPACVNGRNVLAKHKEQS